MDKVLIFPATNVTTIKVTKSTTPYIIPKYTQRIYTSIFFQHVCGSLSNLLKIKVGQGSTDSLQNGSEDQPSHSKNVPMDKTISIEISSPETTEKQLTTEHNMRKSDLARALDNSVDKLDAMIDKAENAQYSMQYQNKQMKAFLNK